MDTNLRVGSWVRIPPETAPPFSVARVVGLSSMGPVPMALVASESGETDRVSVARLSPYRPSLGERVRWWLRSF